MNFHNVREEKGKATRDNAKTHCEAPESPVRGRKENDCYEDHKSDAEARDKAKEEVPKFVESTEGVAKTKSKKYGEYKD